MMSLWPENPLFSEDAAGKARHYELAVVSAFAVRFTSGLMII